MYIKYFACVNINLFDVINSLDFRGILRKISNEINVCNTYSIIQCKIQMICYINPNKLITVNVLQT